MSFDTSDLDQLGADLHAAPEKVRVQVRKVVRKAAVNVKTGWRARARQSAGAHGKHYHRSISFDDGWVATDVYQAEVGPVSAMPQGGMGPGFEYGSINQKPHMDGNLATDAELPRFEQAMADLADGVL